MPEQLRVGSLFTGYSGLDMAVRQVLGGRLAWLSDIDPGACALLAHRHPDVPNLGDVSAINWTAVEPVDVLTGGFPCTDVSLAGRREGLRAGTRSGLWTQMARAIDALRPPLVVIENVRGLCSAPADSDLEPCPWCVGDDEGVPLRALGAVLGDLADLGYDAQWCGLRAADVGAPHGRFRVFILAWRRDLAADAERGSVREQPVGQPWGGGEAVAGFAGEGCPAADTDRVGRERPGTARNRGSGLAYDREPASDADGAGREGAEPAQRRDLSARGVAADAAGPRRGQPRGVTPGAPEGTPAEARGAVGRGGGAPAGTTAADTNGERQQQRARDVADLAKRADHRAARTTNWGIYEPGIRSWEHTLGRSAPVPRTWSTSYRRALQARLDGRNRKPVGMRGSLEPQYSLNPRFVEWMQGLPAGWVTDIPGLTPNQMLRLLGNGVVPQQGAAAITYLLDQAPAFVRAWLAARTHLHAAAAA